MILRNILKILIFSTFPIFLKCLILNLPQQVNSFAGILYPINFYKKVQESATIIESPEISDVGFWSKWQRCSKGDYIIGMKVQYLPKNKVDNQGLIGLKFLCGSPANKRVVKSELEFVSDPHVGVWTEPRFCDGPTIGMLTRNRKQFYHKYEDKVGVTNVQLKCPDLNDVIKPRLDFQPGSWSVPLLCDVKKQALCGVQVQEGSESLSGEIVDGVGINRIRMECCKIFRQEEVCTPWDRYEVIFEYDNSQGLTPAQYAYTKRVGVSGTNGLTTIEKINKKVNLKVEPEIMLSAKLGAVGTLIVGSTAKPPAAGGGGGAPAPPGGGANLNANLNANVKNASANVNANANVNTNANVNVNVLNARQGGAPAPAPSPAPAPAMSNPLADSLRAGLNLLGFSAKFQLQLRTSKATGFEWHKASSDTFQMEKSTSVQVIIEPGYRIRVYQVVGYCGDITVRPDYIYQNGTFTEGQRRGVIDSSGKRRLRWAWKIALGILTSFFSVSNIYFG